MNAVDFTLHIHPFTLLSTLYSANSDQTHTNTDDTDEEILIPASIASTLKLMFSFEDGLGKTEGSRKIRQTLGWRPEKRSL